MRFLVEVRPGRAKDSVEKMGENVLYVSLVARPRDGKANESLRSVLAKYFGVAPSCVMIVKGTTGRTKIVEIFT